MPRSSVPRPSDKVIDKFRAAFEGTAVVDMAILQDKRGYAVIGVEVKDGRPLQKWFAFQDERDYRAWDVRTKCRKHKHESVGGITLVELLDDIPVPGWRDE